VWTCVDAVYRTSFPTVTVVISCIKWIIGISTCADLKSASKESNFKLNGGHLSVLRRKYFATT
jgi:hypothetical protein